MPDRLVLDRAAAALLLTALAALPHASAQEAPAEPGPDAIELPDGSVDELFAFVDEVVRREPEGNDDQSILAHNLKTARTILAISEAVLAKEPSDNDAGQAVSLQMQALNVLRRLGEPGAEKVFAKAVEAARRDERPEVAAFGLKYFIEFGFEKWGGASDEEKRAVVDAVVDKFSAGDIGNSEIQLLMSVSDFLSDMEEGELAKDLFGRTLPKLGGVLPPESLERIEGVARRISLPGSEMELSGTLLGGGDLDWESYRGKVVLVDFWASWCGPCRAEVPNVLELYRAYHEKGFDVVGINLDATEDQANGYISQMGLPWPNLFNQEETAREWEHPMVVYYGVTGIPRAILVDREGKVVSMNARGPELGRLLRKLLGEPVVRAIREGEPGADAVTPASLSE